MIDEAEFRAAVAEGPPTPDRFTVLTHREFVELPEYSTTLPTGTKPGKRWKRRYTMQPPGEWIDGKWTLPPPVPRWFIGEFVDVGSTTEIGIRWTWPLIV